MSNDNDELEETIEETLEDKTDLYLNTADVLHLIKLTGKMMKDESTAAEKVAGSVHRYLKQHERLLAMPPNYWHPSAIAMSYDVMKSMMHEVGGPIAYWQLMLEAAKEWFPNGEPADLYKLFCTRFETIDQELWKEAGDFNIVKMIYDGWRDSLKGESDT